MIEDEIFRYRPSPYIPFELSRYDKHPSRWYGVGLCEKLIAPQKEENRQYTEIIKTSRFNKGRLFVDDPKPHVWAKRAVPFLLSLDASANGKSLTAE